MINQSFENSPYCLSKAIKTKPLVRLYYIAMETGEIIACSVICRNCLNRHLGITFSKLLRHTTSETQETEKIVGLSTSAHPVATRGVAKRQPQSAGAERSEAVVYPVDKPLKRG